MSATSRIRFRWDMEPGEEDDARALAAELRDLDDGTALDEPDRSALACLPIVSGITAVEGLADALVRFRRRRGQERRTAGEEYLGGWVVDTRGAAVTVTRSVDIAYPTMVVLDADGAPTEIAPTLPEERQIAAIAAVLATATDARA